MMIVELKTMQDLENYLAERKLRLQVHGCENLLWAELFHLSDDTLAAVGTGNDMAKALKAAITEYETTVVDSPPSGQLSF
jgi:hypothetical protein